MVNRPRTLGVPFDRLTQGRFDNIATDDLVSMHREALAEFEAIEEAAKARLVGEAKVTIGKAYRIATSFNYKGRIMCVRYLRAERGWRSSDPDRLVLVAEGVLKRPKMSPRWRPYGYFAGAYTAKHVTVPAKALDLDSEQDPVPADLLSPL